MTIISFIAINFGAIYRTTKVVIATALTTHHLQVERRESHRANQVDALTTHQLQVERRESHRDNQVYAL